MFHLVKNDVTSQRAIWRRDNFVQQQNDWLAQEVPAALVYNGISHVVMMVSPQDLEYFALGFSLSEGIVSTPQEIRSIDIIPGLSGVEIQIEISDRRFMLLKQQRRNLNGRTGCGICGTEQLSAIVKPLPALTQTQHLKISYLDQALIQLAALQPIGKLTGCTHVAAWITPQGQLAGGHEDVGRHVALDKLLGRRMREGWQDGAALISSRASYEMVQKSAMCGVEILFAVSAATILAVEQAEHCGLTLVGFSRSGRATIYTHPQRLC